MVLKEWLIFEILFVFKGRNFELLMSEGAYFIQYNSKFSLVYDGSKVLIIYRDEIDCAYKTMWFLDNPEIADKMRKARWMRALIDYTWDNRIQRIFSMDELLEVPEREGINLF